MITITIKDDSVKFDPITPAHAHLFTALERAAATCQLSLVITCGREDHGADDPHTRGEAVDIRMADVPAPMIVRVRQALMTILGPAWTVLIEAPEPPTAAEPQLAGLVFVNRAATARHIHIQPIKGTRWPPAPEPVTT